MNSAKSTEDPPSQNEAEDGLPDNNDDGLATDLHGNDFIDTDVRRVFMLKLYVVMASMFSVTFGTTVAMVSIHIVANYCEEHKWPFVVSLAGIFLIAFILLFWEAGRRKHPFNLILCLLFAACCGACLGVISATFTTDTLLFGSGIITLSIICATVIAIPTKLDLNSVLAIIMTLVINMAFGTILVLIPYGPEKKHKIFIFVATMICLFILLVDIRLLVNQTRRISISANDFTFVVLLVYLEFPNIVFQAFAFVISRCKKRGASES